MRQQDTCATESREHRPRTIRWPAEEIPAKRCGSVLSGECEPIGPARKPVLPDNNDPAGLADGNSRPSPVSSDNWYTFGHAESKAGPISE